MEQDLVSESASAKKSTLIAGRYGVELGQPLTELDSPGAVAFAAFDKGQPARRLYALLQRPGYPRRENVFRELHKTPVSGVLCPLGQGLLRHNFGDNSVQCLVTILERPVAPVFQDGYIEKALTEKQLRTRLIPPLLAALQGLHRRNITHRGICLRNIYYMNEARDQIGLGECFSSPPGMITPPGSEPVESATAIPEGRGEGSSQHDMFALGMLLLSLYLGRDLGTVSGGTTSDEFARQMTGRIRQGSYWALGGGQDISGSMGDMLRGLMEDRSDRRWDADDLKRWLEGIAPRRIAADERWSLVRPIRFGGTTIHDRRYLAFVMSRDVHMAAGVIRNGKFLHWIQNTLVEPLTSDWLEKTLDVRPVSAVGDGGGLIDELAVSKVCSVLDPNGPLRFRGKDICVDGLGYALAVASARGDDEMMQGFHELFGRGSLAALLNILRGRNNSLGNSLNGLQAVVSHIDNNALGYGIKRALYALCPYLPCQSKKLSGHYVDSPARLLKVLEGMAREGAANGLTVDPHVAAFLLHHDKTLEPLLEALDRSKSDPERFAAATLSLLGNLQQNAYSYELPNLARLLSLPIRKAIEKLHGSTLRRHLEIRLSRLVEKGDLARIATELNFHNLKTQDDRNFRAAQRQFSAIAREKQRLERPTTGHDSTARQLGFLGSVYFSAAILAMTLMYLAVNYYV